ncbi:hypothetical protein SAMN04515647_2597 [Cohaesibacter sp. ES.047]|uniref:DUF1178 family protein n=1 Tax=Cohaesibacter sp. ES.047 TaxID=1798205 RepID=UPI000BB6BA65|nr:DUF1178 family protein [Cohaesibacter sp. ES.047]SNY92342.1 hypothetical protein SAMN04515647_2597 [Cohaesibacter sp. ES.047]
MIKYSLRCDSDHQFEGWFRNGEDCEAQTRDGHLECPVCGSTRISKSLMTPRVSGTRSQDVMAHDAAAESVSEGQSQAGSDSQPVALRDNAPDPRQLQAMLRAYRDHVVNNADYVGDKFAEEARKMHFEESEKRGIYGEATIDDVKSLVEDGIDCLPLPTLPEDQN